MQTAFAPTGEVSLWRDLVVARQRIERALEQRLQQDAGISVADFEILTVLCRVEDNRLRARELGDLLGWEKSRLSHQVTRMQARSLVDRRECPTDLRGTWVTLTDTGHRAAGKAMEGYSEVLRESFAALAPRDRESLESAMAALVAGSSGTECTGEDLRS